MRHLVLILLLTGCAAQVTETPVTATPTMQEDRVASSTMDPVVSENVALLSNALEQGDSEALWVLFQPPHPLAQWAPELSADPAWREVVVQWVDDLLVHAGQASWQLRRIDPLDNGWRAQYRLVHDNYSVEYFYFDVSAETLSVEDLGNHLFRMSQVGMMGHLYQRLLVEQDEPEQPFSRFFSTLAPFAEGHISRRQFIAYYAQLPLPLQESALGRDLLLRTLVSSGNDWITDLPSGLRQRVIGRDYPLLMANLCLADLDANCAGRIDQLPEDLSEDVALQTELGIRALHQGQLGAASHYARQALSNSDDYLPAHWLSLQVALGKGDHPAAIASLDFMTHNFDVPVQRDVLFEVFPDAGEALLASQQFVQWAQAQQEP